MMQIILSAQVIKHIRKMRLTEQERFRERRNVFVQDPHDPLLHNHKLHGEFEGCRSINITGDIRVVYEMIAEDIAHFIEIGTHDELYE